MENEKEKTKKEARRFDDLVDMGKFYFLNQKYDEAIREFLEAEKINSKSVDLYLNLGLSYEANNDIVNAKIMYEKTVELDPENKQANERIQKIIDR